MWGSVSLCVWTISYFELFYFLLLCLFLLLVVLPFLLLLVLCFAEVKVGLFDLLRYPSHLSVELGQVVAECHEGVEGTDFELRDAEEGVSY